MHNTNSGTHCQDCCCGMFCALGSILAKKCKVLASWFKFLTYFISDQPLARNGACKICPYHSTERRNEGAHPPRKTRGGEINPGLSDLSPAPCSTQHGGGREHCQSPGPMPAVLSLLWGLISVLCPVPPYPVPLLDYTEVTVFALAPHLALGTLRRGMLGGSGGHYWYTYATATHSGLGRLPSSSVPWFSHVK